jgi:endoribonuclease Dicer
LVGDAVLDMLITQYIFSDPKEHSPGELTDLRQALVNNNFFGSLAIKHRFHVHLSFSSPAVHKLREDFVRKYYQFSLDAAYLHVSCILTAKEFNI